MNLVQAQRVVQSAVEERLASETGLSWSELEVLMRLAIAPGRRLRMIEIADQLLASKSGVTRLVDRLVADGLIAREVPPDNRRVVHGRITDAGLEALGRARATFTAGLDDAFSRHLTDAEVAQLRAITRRLLEGNGAWAEDRCQPAWEDGEHVPEHHDAAGAGAARDD